MDRNIIQEGYLFYFSTSFVYVYIVLKSSVRNATFCKLSCMNYIQVVLLYFLCYMECSRHFLASLAVSRCSFGASFDSRK